MISFLSEHTAEFMLVPRLRSILSPVYASVTPVYYWKTREGNSLSNFIHKNSSVRVLVLFPRRPKLTSPTEENIWGEINLELYEYAHVAFSVGIPVIAGLPLVQSLPDLWKDHEPMWIMLADGNLKDIIFKVDMISKEVLLVLPEGQKLKTIKEKDIPDFVEKYAISMTWSEAIDQINMLHTEEYRGNFQSRFSFFGGYKPVYFFIFNPLKQKCC